MRLTSDDSLVLDPGDNALLFTIEHLRIPPDILAITLPRGLFVGSSLSPGASYIDPGFSDFFCFPVTNTSGRVVRIPYGTELARTLFFHLGTRVDRTYSPNEVTDLITELESLPASGVRSVEQCRAASTNELISTIQGSLTGGAAISELLIRMRYRQVLFLVAAIVWPLALLIADSAPVQRTLKQLGSNESGMLGHVAAGVLVAAILALGPWLFRKIAATFRLR